MNRRKVLWFGSAPDGAVQSEFSNRQLTPAVVSDLDIEPLAHECCAAVFNFSSTNIGEVRVALTSAVASAANHGLLIYLVAENDSIQRHVSDVLAGLAGDIASIQEPDRDGRVALRRRTAPIPAHELPEIIARFDPGPACNDALAIEPPDITPRFDGEMKSLFGRAFHDCTSIMIAPLGGGRSANVFSVHAIFRDSKVGPRPQPFFAKLDARSKIDEERQKYREFATHFIPWHLRPYLEFTRSLLGVSKGILVGGFVDQSESLWDVVRRGQAHAAIFSLFEDTLMGWRVQGFQRAPGLVTGSVAAAMPSHVFNHARIREEHQRVARLEHGIVQTPIQLWEQLLGLKDQKFYRAPMHGDLHGENVRVRGSDAIIIDLRSVADGPLVGDLAALETWLAFEITGDHDEKVNGAEWQRLVTALYSPESFLALPAPDPGAGPFSWLWNSVRQIRVIALSSQACSTEYQTAVAVYLLRRAMWSGDSGLDSKRRALSYALGARLVADLKK